MPRIPREFLIETAKKIKSLPDSFNRITHLTTYTNRGGKAIRISAVPTDRHVYDYLLFLHDNGGYHAEHLNNLKNQSLKQLCSWLNKSVRKVENKSGPVSKRAVAIPELNQSSQAEVHRLKPKKFDKKIPWAITLGKTNIDPRVKIYLHPAEDELSSRVSVSVEKKTENSEPLILLLGNQVPAFTDLNPNSSNPIKVFTPKATKIIFEDLIIPAIKKHNLKYSNEHNLSSVITPKSKNTIACASRSLTYGTGVDFLDQKIKELLNKIRAEGQQVNTPINLGSTELEKGLTVEVSLIQRDKDAEIVFQANQWDTVYSKKIFFPFQYFQGENGLKRLIGVLYLAESSLKDHQNSSPIEGSVFKVETPKLSEDETAIVIDEYKGSGKIILPKTQELKRDPRVQIYLHKTRGRQRVVVRIEDPENRKNFTQRSALITSSNFSKKNNRGGKTLTSQATRTIFNKLLLPAINNFNYLYCNIDSSLYTRNLNFRKADTKNTAYKSACSTSAKA